MSGGGKNAHLQIAQRIDVMPLTLPNGIGPRTMQTHRSSSHSSMNLWRSRSWEWLLQGLEQGWTPVPMLLAPLHLYKLTCDFDEIKKKIY